HFTTKEGGTGLGLFMSYGVVREHQGQLLFEGKRRGAVFTVVLPPFSGSWFSERFFSSGQVCRRTVKARGEGIQRGAIFTVVLPPCPPMPPRSENLFGTSRY